MTGKELYPLVYHVVKQAQKTDKQVFKNCAEMFSWSLKIPKPNAVSAEVAEALCTSVSQSGRIGLELYFPEKVYLEDLIKTNTKDKIEKLLKWEEGGKSFGQLGAIVRDIFTGPLVLTANQKVILENI
jgi:hypothetical protein